MNYWQIDPDTGELLDGPIAPRFDARSKEFLYPRGAILVAPPTPQAGKVIVWNGGQWEHVEDYRGTEWWDEDGNQVIITELGPLPEGLTEDPPPPPTEYLVASIEAAPQKTWPNASAFLAEFSMEEKAAISLSTHPVIAALRLELLSWPGEVWSNDERIRMGMDALVEASILPEFRRQEIIAA